MITVTYNDIDKSAPRVEFRGIVFLDGIPVDVTGKWSPSDCPMGNPWFSVVMTDAPPVVMTDAPPVVITDAPPMTPARAALVAEAEGYGIRVDGRWSDATLMAKIEEARG